MSQGEKARLGFGSCKLRSFKHFGKKEFLHFGTVVLEKTLESPLDSKEINQLILKEINAEY